jgi:preprotein translocase subunit SecE
MAQDKQAVSATPKKQNAVVAFIRDTIAEMKKVTWLSRREIIYLTGLVLLVAVIVGIILGGVDYGFTQLVEKVILGG